MESNKLNRIEIKMNKGQAAVSNAIHIDIFIHGSEIVFGFFLLFFFFFWCWAGCAFSSFSLCCCCFCFISFCSALFLVGFVSIHFTFRFSKMHDELKWKTYVWNEIYSSPPSECCLRSIRYMQKPFSTTTIETQCSNEARAHPWRSAFLFQI